MRDRKYKSENIYHDLDITIADVYSPWILDWRIDNFNIWKTAISRFPLKSTSYWNSIQFSHGSFIAQREVMSQVEEKNFPKFSNPTYHQGLQTAFDSDDSPEELATLTGLCGGV